LKSAFSLKLKAPKEESSVLFKEKITPLSGRMPFLYLPFPPSYGYGGGRWIKRKVKTFNRISHVPRMLQDLRVFTQNEISSLPSASLFNSIQKLLR
jgi:hypothetical protein